MVRVIPVRQKLYWVLIPCAIAALESFPEATVLHLGLFRDKVSLQAIE